MLTGSLDGLDNSNVAFLNGAVTTSWHAAGDQQLSSDAPLFTLVFRANGAGRLQEDLQLNSSLTTAESYTVAGGIYTVAPVQMEVKAAAVAGLELNQNRPNPFREQTRIGFQMPEAGPATFTLTDVSGRVLWTNRDQYSAGYQEIEITRNVLPAAGVYFYRLEAAGAVQTRRMVVE